MSNCKDCQQRISHHREYCVRHESKPSERFEQYLVKYWRKGEGSEFWEYVEEEVSVPISQGAEKDNFDRVGEIILKNHPSARMVSITYV